MSHNPPQNIFKKSHKDKIKGHYSVENLWKIKCSCLFRDLVHNKAYTYLINFFSIETMSISTNIKQGHKLYSKFVKKSIQAQIR